MKKISKSIIGIILAITIFFCGITKPYVVDASTISDVYIINKFYRLLNLKQYEKRTEMTYGAYREMLMEMLTNADNKENRVGFYNVKAITMPVVLDQINAEEYYDVWENAKSVANDIKAYLVYSYTMAYEETDFYYTGARFDVVFIGTVESQRKILSMNRALGGIVEKYKTKIMTLKGVESYAINMNKVCIPQNIVVKLYNGKKITVEFKEYCQKVAAKEVGYDSWPAAYHKACCIALKNYALYHAMTKSDDGGYYVCGYSGEGQDYNPNINCDKWPKLMKALDDTWNGFITNSSGDCFETQYRSGNKSSHSAYNRKSSGILIQNQAKAFAENGKDYKYILEYFYSNSPASNGKALRFISLYNHKYVRIGSYYYECSHCGDRKGSI